MAATSYGRFSPPSFQHPPSEERKNAAPTLFFSTPNTKMCVKEKIIKSEGNPANRSNAYAAHNFCYAVLSILLGRGVKMYAQL